MTRLRPYLNILAFAVTLVINTMSQTTALNGITTADVANRYPDSLYFPANSAFSIWGIIYSFLIAFLIYQVLPAQRDNAEVKKVGLLFIATCVFNALWLLSFQYFQFVLSMVFMLALLGTLILIYTRLDIGGKPVSRRDKWLVHIPFSIYMGWITAATIANATYVLTDLGWNGFGLGNEVWAVIMLAVTGVVGAFIVLTRYDIAYGLVIVWAVGWIAGRYWNTEFTTTAYAAAIVAGVVLLLVLFRAFTMFSQGNRLQPASA